MLLHLTGDINNPGNVERQGGYSAAIARQLQDTHARERRRVHIPDTQVAPGSAVQAPIRYPQALHRLVVACERGHALSANDVPDLHQHHAT